MTDRDFGRVVQTANVENGRPVSQRHMANRRSPRRVTTRGLKLRDNLTINQIRSSTDKDMIHKGTIMNYMKTDGINDQTRGSSFRKWTGMPQTTRANKVPSLALNHTKMISEHRRNMTSKDVVSQNESVMSPADVPARNISQSAWNKIRMVEAKKKDRLNFHP